MAQRVTGWLVALLGMVGGAELGSFLGRVVPPYVPYGFWVCVGLGMVLGFILGLAVGPGVYRACVRATKWVEGTLQRTPMQDIVGGVAGLIIGLIIANLLGFSFYRLPVLGPYLPIAASLIFGALGWVVGTRKREEFFALFSLMPRPGREKRSATESKSGLKILDTSVIIDGRIADIVKTGFIEGTLIIPGFILEELRHVADSSDVLKRNRGRRGLDILNRIRKEFEGTVKIDERDFDDLTEVDSKIIRLAQILGAEVITNDYNLNKVAELQGVKVLNINELANAVKPVVLPGEEMQVQVIKDGKEAGQGVGYLDDGTMIVVENGKRFIGQSVSVLVTSVLQTAAGRMIFARPKVAEKGKNHRQALDRGEYQYMS